MAHIASHFAKYAANFSLPSSGGSEAHVLAQNAYKATPLEEVNAIQSYSHKGEL
jgi:hypothetical protein